MIALVPLKALDDAKSRLGEVLDAEARHDLALRMLTRVVDACLGAGLAVAIVSSDPMAYIAARELGAAVVDDGGEDLTGSVRRGLAAYPDAEAVVVIAGDLPYVTTEDVDALSDRAAGGSNSPRYSIRACSRRRCSSRRARSALR